MRDRSEETVVKNIRIRGAGTALPVGKIVAIGANYTDHIEEMGLEIPKEPMIFLKPSTSILDRGEDLVFPRGGALLHYEVELGLVIGRKCRDVPAADADECVSAYFLGLDMTLRDVQADAMKRGWPWSTSKGFDGACPVSEAIPLADPAHLADLELGLSVNGEVRQRSTTANMIWGPEKLVEIVSGFFTLEAGDLIMTGTPAGVGPVERGDVMKAWLADELELEVKVV